MMQVNLLNVTIVEMCPVCPAQEDVTCVEEDSAKYVLTSGKQIIHINVLIKSRYEEYMDRVVCVYCSY